MGLVGRQHGFLDHVCRYDHIYPYFASKGILVIAYDQRGYGETAEKGMPHQWKQNHTDTSLALLVQDLDFMLRQQRARVAREYGAALPFFLMGHSMGGQLVLTATTRPTGSTEPARVSAAALDGLAGVIAMAPWLNLTHPPPSVLFSIAPAIMRRLPNAWWRSALQAEHFSKDPAVVAVAKQDEQRASYPWVYLRAAAGPLLNGPDVLEDKARHFPRSLPLLVIHGDADPICSYAGSKAFVERATAHDKTLVTMPGHLHEPLQEVLPERTEAANVITEYVAARSSTSTSFRCRALARKDETLTVMYAQLDPRARCSRDRRGRKQALRT